MSTNSTREVWAVARLPHCPLDGQVPPWPGAVPAQGIRGGARHTILSYNFRTISGSTTYSNHARDRLQRPGTLSGCIRDVYRCPGCGHPRDSLCVQWSGPAGPRRQQPQGELHFELVKGAGEPDVATLAARLGGAPAPDPAPAVI